MEPYPKPKLRAFYIKELVVFAPICKLKEGKAKVFEIFDFSFFNPISLLVEESGIFFISDRNYFIKPAANVILVIDGNPGFL